MGEGTITIPAPPEGFEVVNSTIPAPPEGFVFEDEFRQFQTRDPETMREFFFQGSKEIPKALARGTESMIGTGGSFARWMWERASMGGVVTQHIDIPGIGIIAEHLIRKYGPKKPIEFYDKRAGLYAKQGKTWADFWEEQTQKGWEAPNEDILRAKWTERPISKAVSVTAEAAPNYLAAIGMGVLTKNPQVGLTWLSSLSGAQAYRAQREKGTGKWMADKIALMTAAWEYGTEKIPFDEVFKPAKNLFLKMLKVGSMESAQEFFQGLGENFLEHFGYNAKDLETVPLAVREGYQHMLDGWVENVVAGFGLGFAGAGVVPNQQIQDRKEALLTNPPEGSAIEDALPEEAEKAPSRPVEAQTPAEAAPEAPAAVEGKQAEADKVFIKKQLDTLGSLSNITAQEASINDIPKDSPHLERARDAELIANKLGLRVVWYSAKGSPTQGFVHKDHPDIIFSSIDHPSDLVSTIAHEAVHRVARTNPELYKKVLDSLTPAARKKLADRYSLSVAKWHGLEQANKFTKDVAHGDEEAVALIMSDAFGFKGIALEQSAKLRDYLTGRGSREAALDYLKIFASPHSSNPTVTAEALLQIYEQQPAQQALAAQPEAAKPTFKQPVREQLSETAFEDAWKTETTEQAKDLGFTQADRAVIAFIENRGGQVNISGVPVEDWYTYRTPEGLLIQSDTEIVGKGGYTELRAKAEEWLESKRPALAAQPETAKGEVVRPKELTEPYGILKTSIAELSTAELEKRVQRASPYHKLYQQELDIRKQESRKEEPKPVTIQQQAEEQAQKIEKEPKPLNIEKDIDEDELPSVTSARQAMIADDRKALGLDEMAGTQRKSWQKSLSIANKKGIPDKALRIAQEVNENPRALDDEETAGLVVKAARLKNEYKNLMTEITKADDVQMKSLSAESERIEAEFEILSRAIHLSGTEKGRALAAQKLTIDQDYNLISVRVRAKAAKGKALTTEESAKLAKVTTQLEEANSKIEALQKQIDEMAAKRAVKESSLRRYSRMSLEQKDIELNQDIKRLNELIKEGCL